jgi:hypothetical protein
MNIRINDGSQVTEENWKPETQTNPVVLKC